MKAITLWQPWASLIATGAKKIETRSWKTNYRGPLAIHAAKTWNSETDAMMHTWYTQGGLAPLVGKPLDLTGSSYPDIKEEYLPKGMIIAICNLVDCIPTDRFTQKQIEFEKHFGDFTPGRYGWILEDVRLLTEPIPAKGMQGLWNYDIPIRKGSVSE
jgi:hypothetical protein